MHSMVSEHCIYYLHGDNLQALNVLFMDEQHNIVEKAK
jgi:hypothetical protein